MEVNVPDSHISANDGQDLKPGLSDAKAEFFPLSSPAPYSSPSWSEELGHLMMEQKRIQYQNAKRASQGIHSLSGGTGMPRGPMCSVGSGTYVYQIQRLRVFKCFVGGLLFPFCFPLIFLMFFLKFLAWFIWTKGTQEGTGVGEEGAEATQPWGWGGGSRVCQLKGR